MQCILVRQGAGLKILGRHAYNVRVWTRQLCRAAFVQAIGVVLCFHLHDVSSFSWLSLKSWKEWCVLFEAHISKFLGDTHTMLECAQSDSVVLHSFRPSVYSCASIFTMYRHFRDFRTSREKNDMKYSKPISHNYWRTRMRYYSVLWAMLLWCLYWCHVRLPMLQKKRYIHTGC